MASKSRRLSLQTKSGKGNPFVREREEELNNGREGGAVSEGIRVLSLPSPPGHLLHFVVVPSESFCSLFALDWR